MTIIQIRPAYTSPRGLGFEPVAVEKPQTPEGGR